MIVCDEGLCAVCGTCIGVCPVDAISLGMAAVAIDDRECIRCLACVKVCPVAALSTSTTNMEGAL